MKTRLLTLAVAAFGLMLLAGCSRSPQQKAAAYQARGKAFVEKHDYGRAGLELNNAIRVMPNDPEPRYQLALVYLQQNRTREAVALLRRAVALDPKHIGSQLKLTELMLASPSLDTKAEDRVDEVLAERPDDTDAMFVKAALQARMGRAEDAEQYLRKTLDKSPTYLKSSLALAVMKIGSRDYRAAEQVLQKAVADSPQSVDAALALGKFLVWRGKTAEAETALRRAVQIDAKNGAALISLGALYLKAGRYGEAEAIYKQISDFPEREYKPVYGVFLVMQGRLNEAIPEMEKLTKAYPEDRPARDLLVATYLKANRIETAQKLLDVALKRNPRDADALLQHSRIAITTGKLTAAMNELTAYLSSEPASPSGHFFVARVHELLGSYQQQKQHLAEAVRLAPLWLAARIELSNALISSTNGKTSNGKAALDTLAGASDEQKRSIPFLVAWNWALMSTGDVAGARKGVDRGLAIAANPDLYLQDGVLKMTAKDYPGARAALQQSLEGRPGDLHTLNTLIETYVAENNLAAGIQKVRRYIAQRPPSPANTIFLAEWLLKANQTFDARQVLDRASQADLHNTSLQLMLAELDLKEQKVDAARRRLTTILAAEPQEPRAHMLMASLESLNGDTTKAIEHYRIPAEAGNIVAINNLAFNLAKDDLGLDTALKYAQMAKEIAPNDSHVADTLGWIYYRKGMFKRAATELELALAKEARPGIKLHLGLTYVKLGETAKGQKMAREAVDADPTLPVGEVSLLSR